MKVDYNTNGMNNVKTKSIHFVYCTCNNYYCSSSDSIIPQHNNHLY